MRLPIPPLPSIREKGLEPSNLMGGFQIQIQIEIVTKFILTHF
jgi:hypothetical protein